MLARVGRIPARTHRLFSSVTPKVGEGGNGFIALTPPAPESIPGPPRDFVGYAGDYPDPKWCCAPPQTPRSQSTRLSVTLTVEAQEGEVGHQSGHQLRGRKRSLFLPRRRHHGSRPYRWGAILRVSPVRPWVLSADAARSPCTGQGLATWVPSPCLSMEAEWASGA
jgi:hypothetical protein